MGNPLFDAMQAGRARGDGVWLRFADGSSLSHDEFFALSARYANALVSAGVGVGDRVAMQVAKSPQALALYVASVQSGAVFLPLNPGYTKSELTFFMADAEPAVLVLDPGSADVADLLEDQQQCRVLTLAADGSGSLSDAAANEPHHFSTVARAADDLAAILYTSGTTGRSKGAMLTQRNLLSNALTLIDYWQFTADDVLLHALPIFHTHGLFVASNTLLIAGGSMLFLPSFNTDAVLHALPQVTTMMGVPTFYTRLLADARFTQSLAAHMRLFISGSAPMLAETHTEFETRTGKRILERYGMTETNMNTSNPYDGERVAGTVGLPLPGVEVKVCDPENGAVLANGEIGVLQVRGPNVFKGYWRLPEKTREELLEDGYFVTGDLATRDDAGYITIVGRGKDLIISGGLNVYPKEVELLLDAQTGVLESAVVGAPHPDFGEAVVAIVVREENNASHLTEAQLLENVREQIARFKQPKRIVLPRSASLELNWLSGLVRWAGEMGLGAKLPASPGYRSVAATAAVHSL